MKTFLALLFISANVFGVCTQTMMCDLQCGTGLGWSADSGMTCYPNSSCSPTICSGGGGCVLKPVCDVVCGAGNGWSADNGATCYPNSSCSPTTCGGGGGCSADVSCCGGAGYKTAGICYSNNLCTISCGSTPELPSSMRFITPLFAILGGGLLLRRARRKTKDNKSDTPKE